MNTEHYEFINDQVATDTNQTLRVLFKSAEDLDAAIAQLQDMRQYIERQGSMSTCLSVNPLTQQEYITKRRSAHGAVVNNQAA